MIYRILADLIVLVHLGFILFVVLGGLFVLKWRKLAWVHIPLAIWGAVVELANLICPLTPLENYLRELGGASGYQIDFVEQYIVPVVYTPSLDLKLQIILGSLVIVVNLLIYGLVYYKLNKSR